MASTSKKGFYGDVKPENRFLGPKGEKYFRDVLSDLLLKIDTDMKDVDSVINNIKESFGGTKDRGTNTRCKLMGLDFFYQCSKLEAVSYTHLRAHET